MSIQLAQGLRAHRSLAATVVASVIFFCGVSQAHVALDSPKGGESLTGGSNFSIEWHVEVEHNQLDWDLWYSTVSKDGPWQEIAVDLATGNPAAESIHSFDWSVPNADIATAWVRVRQDNAGMDYYGISDSSFSIAALLGGADFTGDGSVNSADLAVWELGFGTPSGAASSSGDANLDNDVDGADFLAWQGQYNGVRAATAAQSVPEPAASLLLLLGMIVLLLRRF